jgi:hypothetical protein
MTNQTRKFGALGALGLAMLTWACQGKSASIPTSASPAQLAATPAPQRDTFSGLVRELTTTGLGTPVEGVLVAEANSHQTASTDKNGAFTMVSVSGPVAFSLTKPGYFTRAIATTLPPSVIGLTLPIVAIPEAYTLSGLVYEMTPAGRVPVAGVQVEGFSFCCSQRQIATTGENGQYSLSLYAGESAIYVNKAGYDFDGPILSNCDNCDAIVTLNGDTRFDIAVVRH